MKFAIAASLFAVSIFFISCDRTNPPSPSVAKAPATMTVHRNLPSTKPTKRNNIAKITSAKYDGLPGDNGRDVVIVNGEGFDPNDSKDLSKCVTSHDDGATWNNCTGIDDCNGSYYKALIADTAAFKVVWISVLGTDGEWADARIIQR